MKKPEALRLADELEAPVGTQSTFSAMHQAAAELRRLHAENAALAAALASSCDEQRHELWESGGVAGCERARVAERQREALHADAKRYHWILRHYAEFHGKWTLAAFQRRAQEKGIGPGLDGAIDAEIAAEFADAAIDAAMGKT